MPVLKLREGECPCGEPVRMQMWEAPIRLCFRHSVAWLKSREKRDLGEVLQKYPEQPVLEIPRGRAILASFLHRCEREAKPKVKVRRAIAWIWGKTIGRIL